MYVYTWMHIWQITSWSPGFPCGSADKESACNAGDLGLIPGLGRSPEGEGCPLQYSGLGLIPGLGRSPGEGNDNPLQYSCLENPMDRGAW